MPPKPHRLLIDRVSGYAAEAAAYMRRRRSTRRPFVRVVDQGARGYDYPVEEPTGAELQRLAGDLIEALESAKKHEI